jgi:hypothetical protein
LTRKAAADGDAAQRIAETVEFDHAISEALRYAGAKSMILVCSDVAIRARRPRPEEDLNSGEVAPPPPEIPAGEAQQTPDVPPEPAAAATIGQDPATPLPDETSSPGPGVVEQSKAGDETAEDVLAFGTGLGANALHGVAESTVIFDIIRDNL